MYDESEERERLTIACHVLSPTKYRMRIRRGCLHGTSQPETILEGPGLAEDISVDWTTGNIYWTCSRLGSSNYIAVADKDGRYKKTLLTGIEKPRGIVLHPKKRLVLCVHVCVGVGMGVCVTLGVCVCVYVCGCVLGVGVGVGVGRRYSRHQKKFPFNER